MIFWGVNLFAVLAAAIAWMVIGFLWYSPLLFARPWMVAMGFDPDNKAALEQMRKETGKLYGIAFVASLISAAVLAKLFHSTGTVSLLRGLKIAFAVWIGFVATVQLTGTLFGKRSTKLFMIDTGYQLVSYLASGAILSVWQ